MTRHSDFLQKISSTTTPPKGREVVSMDKIVIRELSGRCLDEANMKQPPAVKANDLINRLFGTPKKPLITAKELNKRYQALVDNADDKETAPTQNPDTTSIRNLRSRTLKPAGPAAAGDEETAQTSRNLRLRRSKRARQAAVDEEEAASTQNVKKGPSRNLRAGKSKGAQPANDDQTAPAQNSDPPVTRSHIPLYNTKAKRWNITSVEPRDSNIVLDYDFLQDFEHPKPPTLYTGTSMLVDPVADGPVLGAIQSQRKGNPGPSDTGPLRVVFRRGDGTDAEVTDAGSGKTDEESPSSLEDHPRQGAVHDGNDKDYLEGGQRKRKKGKQSTQVSPEAHWAAFLNTVAITSSPPGSGHGRQWHHSFATKPLPSEEGEAQWNRKPDLVLLEHQESGHRGTGVTWRNIKALGELTTSKLEKNTTLIHSLHTKAYILLCSQPWRRYVLAFSIADTELRIHFFDRSGVVNSLPVKFHSNVVKICHIMRAFAHAADTVLGFDPTLEIFRLPLRQPSYPSIGTIQLDDTTYSIIAILWTSNGFIGRCTNIFHVRPQGAPPPATNGKLDKFDYVVKDCWLEEHLIDHEEHILEHISGITGVPSLVKAWTVQYQGSNDTTLRHRPSNWNSLALTPRHMTRVHRRLLMTPVGSPLSSFRSQRELLHGLISGLEIHERLVTEKGVLHRDISPNNMVFDRSNQPGERSLLMIDFDYAVCLDGSTAQYPKGTGTLPFVSLAILRQVNTKEEVTSVLHEVADDLESFFYVFTWICVLYNGPNGALVSPPEDNTSIVHGWGEAAIRTGGLANAMNAKSAFIHAPNQIIEDQFTPYFQNLKPLARKWKKLVEIEDKRRESLARKQHNIFDRTTSDDPDEPSGSAASSSSIQPLSHHTIIDLLRRHAHNLPSVDPSPQIPSDSPSP